LPRYETTIVDEETTCVVTRDRGAAKSLATKLIRDGKDFEAHRLPDDRWRFIIDEQNERKRWWVE
jgi:hypothetical protein